VVSLYSRSKFVTHQKMGEELSVGFRFYPTEVELLTYYLRIQLGGGNATIHSLIPILDVFSVEPTQLPSTYAIISYINNVDDIFVVYMCSLSL